MSQQNTPVAKRFRSMLRAKRKGRAARRIPHQGVVVDRAMVLDHRYRQEHGLAFEPSVARVKLPTKEQRAKEREWQTAQASIDRNPRKERPHARRETPGFLAAAWQGLLRLIRQPATAVLLVSLVLLTGCGGSSGFYNGVKDVWGAVGPEYRDYVMRDETLGPPGVMTDARLQILRSSDLMDAHLEAERIRQEQRAKNPFPIGWPSTQPTN
jgi:hypothetical protein